MELNEVEELNREILASGVCILVNFEGTKLFCYPRGRISKELITKLRSDDGRLGLKLCRHLVNVARLQ